MECRRSGGFFVTSLVDHGGLSTSHGLAVTPSDSGFRVSMSRSGSFTRLVDLLAILGIQSEYSRILWDSSTKDFSESSSARKYPFSILVENLHEYFEEHLRMTTVPHRTILLDEDCYMLNFVASHFARYRPEIWRRIVDGEGKETSMIHFRSAFQRIPLMYEKLVATFMGTARGTAPKNTLLIYEDVRTHGLAFTSDGQL